MCLLGLGVFSGCVLDPEPASPLAAKPASSASWTNKMAGSASSFGTGVKNQFVKLTSFGDDGEPELDPRLSLDTQVKVSAQTYVATAHMNERRNNDKAAQQKYELALEADPKYLPALLGLARLHDRNARYDAAEVHYCSATEYHPQVAAAWNDLGICLARQGQYAESIWALEQAVTLEPNKPLFANNLAKVHLSQGQTEAALARLNAVHAPAVAHYNAGYLLHELGYTPQAIAQFERALQIDPQLAAARSWHQSLSMQLAQAPARQTRLVENPAAAIGNASTYSFLPHGAVQPNMAAEPANTSWPR